MSEKKQHKQTFCFLICTSHLSDCQLSKQWRSIGRIDWFWAKKDFSIRWFIYFETNAWPVQTCKHTRETSSAVQRRLGNWLRPNFGQNCFKVNRICPTLCIPVYPYNTLKCLHKSRPHLLLHPIVAQQWRHLIHTCKQRPAVILIIKLVTNRCVTSINIILVLVTRLSTPTFRTLQRSPL